MLVAAAADEPYNNDTLAHILRNCAQLQVVAEFESVLLLLVDGKFVLRGRHAMGSMEFEVCFVCGKLW